MKDRKPDVCICGIVAVGPNNVIGRDGAMPWHSKQDFWHFKHVTMGCPCIFGKTTYENLPKKPLPGRLNIVCSSSYKIERQGDVIRVPSLEEAIKQSAKGQTSFVPGVGIVMYDFHRVFICGGAVLYKYALDHDLIDVMYVTKIHNEQLEKEVRENPNAFTCLPYKFDKSKWRKTRIRYQKQLLPEETSATKAVFYKYSRTR